MRQYKYTWHRPAILVALSMAFTIFLLPSCDNGNGCIDGSGGIISVPLNLNSFHSIVAESVFEIQIEQGTEQLVVIEGQQNIIDHISTIVSDSIWLISLTGECYNELDIVVKITLPTIKSIESIAADRVILNSFDNLDQFTVLVSGSGRFFQSGVLNISDRLVVESTGSGEIKANFDAERLDVLISGSADVILTGTTNSQAVTLSGSGSYLAFDLTSRICTMDNSGSGNAEVFVEDELQVKISASGNVSYKGSPTINSMITGSGKLIDAN